MLQGVVITNPPLLTDVPCLGKEAPQLGQFVSKSGGFSYPRGPNPPQSHHPPSSGFPNPIPDLFPIPHYSQPCPATCVASGWKRAHRLGLNPDGRTRKKTSACYSRARRCISCASSAPFRHSGGTASPASPRFSGDRTRRRSQESAPNPHRGLGLLIGADPAVLPGVFPGCLLGAIGIPEWTDRCRHGHWASARPPSRSWPPRRRVRAPPPPSTCRPPPAPLPSITSCGMHTLLCNPMQAVPHCAEGPKGPHVENSGRLRSHRDYGALARQPSPPAPTAMDTDPAPVLAPPPTTGTAAPLLRPPRRVIRGRSKSATSRHYPASNVSNGRRRCVRFDLAFD